MQPKWNSSGRRAFTPAEDAHLIWLKRVGPTASWEVIAARMHDRSARQCRERFLNYLSPELRQGPWSAAEDELLFKKVDECGNKWAAISQCFEGRSENDVKNRWHSHLKNRRRPGAPIELPMPQLPALLNRPPPAPAAAEAPPEAIPGVYGEPIDQWGTYNEEMILEELGQESGDEPYPSLTVLPRYY